MKDIIAKKKSVSSSEEKVHVESVVASELAIPARGVHFVEVTGQDLQIIQNQQYLKAQ